MQKGRLIVARKSVSKFRLGAITIILSGTILGTADLNAQGVNSSGGNLWTGFYIGLNAGRTWKKESTSLAVVNDSPNYYFIAADIPGVNASGTTLLDDNGFSGGAQFGYNHQAGSAVWSVESDFDYLGLNQFYGGPFNYTTVSAPYQLRTSDASRWLLGVRPRLGWTVDRWMIYGTGGLAISHSRFQQDFSEDVFTPIPEQIVSPRTQAGWTAGAGLEGFLGDHWSAKGEYLFSRFGGTLESGQLSGGNGFSPAAGFVDGATFNNTVSSSKIHAVRVGVNFHF